MTNNRLVWIDCETFGLNPVYDPILEIGIRVTDLDLEFLSQSNWLLWDEYLYQGRIDKLKSDREDGDSGASIVYNMHKESGLFEEAKAKGINPISVESEIVAYLRGLDLDKSEPMCGSSIQFDRLMLDYWMPDVTKMFSYRNIDVSTVKELCVRYNTQVSKALSTLVIPKKQHRVIPDLEDTINEFNHYRNYFLFTGE